MDDEAHKLGYKSWAEYTRVCDKIEADCEARGVPFDFDMVPSYTPLHSGIQRGNLILSSPDKDYEPASSSRTWLNGLCLRIKQSLESRGLNQVTVSPITNLTWRVCVGQTVVFEVVLQDLNKVLHYNYSYLNAAGRSFSGDTTDLLVLKELILRVGV